MPPRLALLLALAVLLPAAEAGDAPLPGAPVKTNRLAQARSPYLRQHATNPVDWYPWGEEAWARARRENKPVFLSVGYAACHWCHVMEHESFEDEATAALLGETFVCIKVDREERPDVDALYMQAVHVMVGRGGWPMTVLLTPDREPFWAGTYLPRENLQALARQVGELWRTSEPRLRQQASVVAERVREIGDGQALPPFEGSDEDLLHILDTALLASFDRARGGYGSRPKFPPHAELLYLLDRLDDGDEDEGRRLQVLRTLDAMADGGIHDHVGGGFHRYSTDADWLLPHFEKMLYDNALLAQAYSRAYARTGDERYARLARRTLAWVERDLARPGGGYASSLDADTEGEEGITYTWTEAEIRDRLEGRDADLAVAAWGLREAGNFHDEATGRWTGRNVLHHPRPLGEIAAEQGIRPDVLRARLDHAEAVLLAARRARPQPALDDKVITAWNGLLLSAFARAGADLAEPAFLAKGRALARTLLARSRDQEGRLLRFPADDGDPIPGFCEDHVHLAEGLLDLAEATGEEAWAEAARALGDRILRHFEDETHGGFFATSDDLHEALFARRKETFDSPIPSDNGTAARLFLRLAARTGEEAYARAADRALDAWRPLLAQARGALGVAALYRALALRVSTRAARSGTSPSAGDVHVERTEVEATLFLERLVVRPGVPVRFALRLELAPGWHVNPASGAAEGFVPTTLRFVPGDGGVLARVDWPEVQTVAEGPPGYTGIVWIRGELVLGAAAPTGETSPLRLVLGVQPCETGRCLAPIDLDLPLPLARGAADGEARYGPLFGDG